MPSDSSSKKDKKTGIDRSLLKESERFTKKAKKIETILNQAGILINPKKLKEINAILNE